jgi:hypothetical protein
LQISDPSAISSLLPFPPHADPHAWEIVRNFATSDDISLPGVENALQTHLGDRFVDSDWRPALAAVMEAEGDADKALSAINNLYENATHRSGLKLRIPARSAVYSKPHQAVLVEAELMDQVAALKSRNQIFGAVQSVDRIVDPVEERQQEESVLDGSVKGIADLVRKEIAEDEVVEVVDSDEDEDGPPIPSRADLINYCRQLEIGCMHYGDPKLSLEISHNLFKFRGILRRAELANSTQSTLDSYFL